MKKRFILLLFICLLSIVGCATKHICKKCEKATTKIYYDVEGEISYCKDCAREYWLPLDYEKYRVKD